MANLIFDYTVPSNTTSVTIDLSSTPIQKGELYEMSMNGVSDGSTTSLYIYANNNQTNTNYYQQRLLVSGTSVSGWRDNSSYFANLNPPTRPSTTKSYIRLTNDGYFTVIVAEQFDTGANVTLRKHIVTSTFTMTSITQLDIVDNGVDGIGANSRIQLYKVANKVAEQEVTGSAVTSVQFSGLNIGKGNEYLLVGDLNGRLSSSGVFLYVNNNQTNSNYYYQRLDANSTTIAGARANNPVISFLSGGDSTLTIAKIKLTNDGYITTQVQNGIAYGTSSIRIWDIAKTSTFTETSITQLDIKSEVAVQLDVGSRFELYKLV